MSRPREYVRIGDLTDLKADVKDIKENHLPHIKTAIAWMQGGMWVLVPVVVAILGIVIYLLRG